MKLPLDEYRWRARVADELEAAGVELDQRGRQVFDEARAAVAAADRRTAKVAQRLVGEATRARPAWARAVFGYGRRAVDAREGRRPFVPRSVADLEAEVASADSDIEPVGYTVEG